MKLTALLLVLVAVSACAVAVPAAEQGTVSSAETKPGPGSTMDVEIDYLAHHGCRTQMVPFKPAPGATKRKVFALVEGDGGVAVRPTWHHDTNDCLDVFLAAVQANPTSEPLNNLFYWQMLYELSQPNVALYKLGSAAPNRLIADVVDADANVDASFDRISYLTEPNGFAYEGQVQVDMGKWLLQAYGVLSEAKAAQTPAHLEAFRTLGLATMNVITDPAGTEPNERGLRARSACGHKSALMCSWFYAVTANTRGSTEEGATLNKNLQVIRDLWLAGDLVDAYDHDRATPYRDASLEGMNQLVYADGNDKEGKPPRLLDFVPRAENGDPLSPSWLYYSVTPTKQGAYFLKKHTYKNCGYDVRNLTLLATIFAAQGDRPSRRGFVEPKQALGGKSLLEHMVATYQQKLDQDGLWTAPAPNTVPAGASFDACDRELTPEIPASTLTSLRALYAPAAAVP